MRAARVVAPLRAMRQLSFLMCSGLYAFEQLSLRSYLHWRAVIHNFPYLFNLLVCNRDAAISPIVGAMRGSHKTISVGQAVDVDISARWCSAFSRSLSVGCIGIRNMQ